MYKIYKILSYTLLPVILINLFLRIIKKKEDNVRYVERYGKTNYEFNNSEKIIWIHASSIGEFKSSDLIIENYYKSFKILVTTTTKTSAEYIQKYYSDKVIHQYIPFDLPIWCSRFIDFWKPILILWIESDIWPNMMNEIKKRKINSFYVNARVSPKSFKRWQLFQNLYSDSLSSFNTIYAQSPNDLKRIAKLTNKNHEYIGNLKLANIKNKLIREDIEKKSSIMIVSSHKKEEEIIIKKIHKIIKTKNIKIFIAPRHPERSSKIIDILNNYNLSHVLHSKNSNKNSDVTIIDSFGDLESYFLQSQIVILGGSFISKGGHNPLEPASYGCAIISGNSVYNWQNIYEDMMIKKACIIIEDINDIESIINDLIINKSMLKELKNNAIKFSKINFFDNKILINKINMVLS